MMTWLTNRGPRGVGRYCPKAAFEGRTGRSTALLLALATTVATAQGTQPGTRAGVKPPLPSAALRAVAPALEGYTRKALFGDLWKRPGLTSRDRCLATLAALVARNQMEEIGFYLNLALDEGVKPEEISELLTHLAFYAGWGNAMAAVKVTEVVFTHRRIPVTQLPLSSVSHLPIDEVAEAKRASITERSIGSEFPGLVQYTNDLLFRDLWLRPGLAPRDRSLVTISALIASGQLAPFANHLNRAMDFGLTEPQAAEVLTHVAFYAGWPYAVSAAGVARDVFATRR